jgi:hypothetical protein
MERKPKKPEKRGLLVRIRERIRKIAEFLLAAAIIIVSLIEIAMNAPKLRPLFALLWP